MVITLFCLCSVTLPLKFNLGVEGDQLTFDL